MTHMMWPKFKELEASGADDARDVVSVSRRTKVKKITTSRSRLGLGYLRLVPKTLCCPYFARHIDKIIISSVRH